MSFRGRCSASSKNGIKFNICKCRLRYYLQNDIFVCNTGCYGSLLPLHNSESEDVFFFARTILSKMIRGSCRGKNKDISTLGRDLLLSQTNARSFR